VRIVRLCSCVLAIAMLMLSGCAVNRSTANVDPTANLAAIKRVHVVHDPEDGRKINELIAGRLTQMGYVATTSDAKRTDVDADITYLDKWMWDLTMYMIELTVVVRDPATQFPMATGNSLHTSLTRKSTKEMVEEVTTNIFKGVQK
jgi:hypothetical protein